MRSLARVAATPIVVLTGRHLVPEEGEEGLQAEVSAVLHKPVEAGRLESEIRAALAGG